jgi:uncharacterized membrane protein YeaQ/YmgE (transglycosylase-associated protein family)
MAFLTWILLGLVSGCIGRNIVNKRGRVTLFHIVLGLVLVIAGKWLLGPAAPTTEDAARWRFYSA